jgi:hypothetical protein
MKENFMPKVLTRDQQKELAGAVRHVRSFASREMVRSTDEKERAFYSANIERYDALLELLEGKQKLQLEEAPADDEDDEGAA